MSLCQHTKAGRIHLQFVQADKGGGSSTHQTQLDAPQAETGTPVVETFQEQHVVMSDVLSSIHEDSPASGPSNTQCLPTLAIGPSMVSQCSTVQPPPPIGPETASTVSEHNIDPVLLHLDAPQSPNPFQQTLSLPETPQSYLSRESEAVTGLKNPLYGCIEGAKRGVSDWPILRTTRLRPFLMTSKQASARFARCMEDLVVHAERLSHKKNCWLLLAAQHPQIVNSFADTINNLQNARRTDAIELSQKLSEANRSKERAEAELARQQVDLAEKDALISEYRSRLGLS
ncbi:hypothetical protein SERLADRAFT_441875 [Serpula lacrymans var. lacrymans S7.9]|uniref:Uncharacterized protein n=1 Tax=Serpula lacrymans var. lacrymans (strain S7.9) TaxID=578457 RepID=F8P7X3_SERL9|nr:uncharacterized protein SERLADRAFT_441875 [Serpula lacrymans var. lacrymans S7.9]EGO20531.1 hypothetical protein SERLADRAFT_441875 [Serpula lacrymans var. lacrymans S7.9]